MLLINTDAYYTALEHMINNSEFKTTMLRIMPEVLDPDEYEIEDFLEKKTNTKYQLISLYPL